MRNYSVENNYVSAREQKTEALEIGTKQFEELEFCQLEEESRMEEKKEAQSSQLLQERTEYHSSVAQRKVRTRVCCHPSWQCLLF